MNPVLLTVNTISALVTIASAFLAIYRPGLMVHASSVDANTRFYVYMYAVRAIPAGIAVLIAPFYFRGGAVALLLATFAVIQAGDAFIGWTRKEWGMVFFPSLSAVVHTVVALSGRIEIALNEGKDCPQDIAPMYTGSVSGTGMRSCVSQRKPASDVL